MEIVNRCTAVLVYNRGIKKSTINERIETYEIQFKPQYAEKTFVISLNLQRYLCMQVDAHISFTIFTIYNIIRRLRWDFLTALFD